MREADLHISAGGDATGWIGSLVVVQIRVPGRGELTARIFAEHYIH